MSEFSLFFFFFFFRFMCIRYFFSLWQNRNNRKFTIIPVFKSIAVLILVQRISRKFSHSTTEILYSLNSSFQFPSPASDPCNHTALSACAFDSFKYLIQTELCHNYLFMTGLFHWAECPQGSYVLLHLTRFPFFS